jgi:hypothetical protein
MSRKQRNESRSNSKNHTPRKLGWFDTLWKYRWPIAAVVTAVGVGLAITVATSGVGVLVVAPVAAIAVASYAPETVAAITLAAVGGAGLLGFGINRAVKLSKSKSLGNEGEFTWKGFFKELLGTDEKTKNTRKLFEQSLVKRNFSLNSKEKKGLYETVIDESVRDDNLEEVVVVRDGIPGTELRAKSIEKFLVTVSKVIAAAQTR